MKTVTRYKVTYTVKNKIERTWFNSKEEADAFVKKTIHEHPESEAHTKGWDFLVHDKMEVVKRVRFMNPSSTLMEFLICKYQDGTFKLDIEPGHTFDKLFASVEDAEKYIEEYIKTPFMFQGMPMIVPGTLSKGEAA